MEIVSNEAYVSFELAILLKEAGFDWECRCYYETSGKLRGKNSGSFSNHNSPFIWQNNGNTETQLYSSPTIDVAQRWLREVKLISVEINVIRWFNRYQTNECTIFWKYIILSIDTSSQEAFYRIVDIDNGFEFNTCEEASEAGVKKALKIITSKQWKSLVKETV